MKPGPQTTEFWVATGVQIITFAQGIIGTISPAVAAWIMGALAVAYVVARSFVKIMDSLNGAPVVITTGATGSAPDARATSVDAYGQPILNSLGEPVTVQKLCILLLASCFLLAIGGCASDESNRVAQGMIMVDSHAQIVDGLVRSGKLSADQAKELQALVHAENAATDAYYDAIRAGDNTALALAKVAEAQAADALAKVLLQKYGITSVAPIALPPLPPPPPTPATTRAS
jgi:hypothetical protein